MRWFWKVGCVVLAGLFFYLLTGSGVDAFEVMVLVGYLEWRFGRLA